MRAMLSRDTLRQEMTSLQNLITEKETQLFGDFEEVFKSVNMTIIVTFYKLYATTLYHWSRHNSLISCLF